jgi:hypothetical protein
LEALKGLAAAGKYTCQLDMENNIIVLCNEAENQLYRLTAQEEKSQKTLTEWLKKQCN